VLFVVIVLLFLPLLLLVLLVREARGSEVVLRASAGFFALTTAHAECCSLRV